MAVTLHADMLGNSWDQLPYKQMSPFQGIYRVYGFMVFKDDVRLLGASFFWKQIRDPIKF